MGSIIGVVDEDLLVTSKRVRVFGPVWVIDQKQRELTQVPFLIQRDQWLSRREGTLCIDDLEDDNELCSEIHLLRHLDFSKGSESIVKGVNSSVSSFVDESLSVDVSFLIDCPSYVNQLKLSMTDTQTHVHSLTNQLMEDAEERYNPGVKEIKVDQGLQLSVSDFPDYHPSRLLLT